MARRRYMHGKRRRKSSCAPFKHIISMRTEDQHDHPHPDESGDDEETTEPANTITEAVADANFDPSVPSVRQATAYNTRPKPKTKSVSADDTLDNIQNALNYAGLTPGYGIFADLANVGISAGRSLYGLATGDYEYAKEHGKETAWHTGAAIPMIGHEVTAVKIGKQGINLSKKAAKVDTRAVNVQKDRTIEAMQSLEEIKPEDE